METIVTYPRLRLADQTIEGARIVFRFGKQETDDLIRCRVVGCELVLEEPCWTYFLDCTFENCLIIAKKECAQMWSGNRWVDCTFIGDFAMGFGQRGEDCPQSAGPMVINCDFTQTICDITLVEADLPTIKFPQWPNITILEPGKHKSELRSLKFPKALEIWWFGQSGNAHPSYSSRSFNWEKIVRKQREFKPNSLDFEPYTEDVRSILGSLPYVIL